jgi:hypothetical protein
MAHHYEDQTIDVIPSVFDMFEKYQKSDVAASTLYEEVYPTSNVTGVNNTNPMTFKIHGTDQVVDFSHSYILITGEMTGTYKTGAGNAIPIDNPNTKVGPVNNFPNCLFSRMTVLMNNKEVTATNNLQYQSYLNTRLCHDNATLQNYFKLEGWIPDIPGDFDNTDSSKADSALKARKALSNDRKIYQFLIRPAASVFTMDKVLIPHVDVEIILDRNSSPPFYLMYPETENTVYTFGFNITQATMYVRKMDMNSEYTLGLNTTMTNAMAPVIYNLRNPNIIAENIPANKTIHSVNDAFHGFVPERVLVAFVETAAYRGKANLNPFNFKNFDIEYIGLFKNSVAYPHPPLRMKFVDNLYAQAYYLTASTLQAPDPGAPIITYEEFKSGTTIFSYDLTPDQAGGVDPHHSIKKTANIRIDVKFGTPLPSETMMLIYYEQDVRVAIDHIRSVSVETIY